MSLFSRVDAITPTSPTHTTGVRLSEENLYQNQKKPKKNQRVRRLGTQLLDWGHSSELHLIFISSARLFTHVHNRSP
ncbi:hypothetical protein CCP2SC5_530009 [Azospirillaceae bacterium]